MTGETNLATADTEVDVPTWVYVLFIGVGLLVSSALCLYTVSQVLEIEIFRHDALNYATSYFKKLRHEGRWINYLLFDFLHGTPGRVDALVNLAAFFGFSFIAAYRWTRNAWYALLVALLMVQAFPLYAINLWPFAAMPAFLFLFAAALLRPYLPLYLFFPLFGTVFFAAYSGFYYLLPLLYLDLLKSDAVGDNLRVFFASLLPAWAAGFLVGYAVLLLAVHHKTGQWGLDLATWRTPQDATGLPGLAANALRSFEYLQLQLSEIFSGTLRLLLLLACMLAVFLLTRKALYLSLLLVAVSVMLAHYIIVIPVGVEIKTRTIIGLWAGVFILAFYIPAIGRRQVMLMVPALVAITGLSAIENRAALQWYEVVTRTWQQQLLQAAPLAPADYDGVVFLSDDDSVARAAALVAERAGVQKHPAMEGLHHKHRWMPVAMAAGFKKVWLCADADLPVCRTPVAGLPVSGDGGLYRVWSDAGKRLLVVEFDQAQLPVPGADPG